MPSLSRGISFSATEQITNTKLHNLIDLTTISGISASDLGTGFLTSLPTTSGQLNYYNFGTLISLPTTIGQIPYWTLVQSLASGSVPIYNGTTKFVGSVMSAGGGNASVPSTSTYQYWSPRFLATLSINWNNGNVQYVTLASGSNTVAFSNPQDGARYALIMKQPSGGYGTVSLPTIALWPANIIASLTTTASKVDILTLLYDNANTRYYLGYSLNY